MGVKKMSKSRKVKFRFENVKDTSKQIQYGKVDVYICCVNECILDDKFVSFLERCGGEVLFDQKGKVEIESRGDYLMRERSLRDEVEEQIRRGELKKKRAEMLRKYHPDKDLGDKDRTQLFQILSDLYE